MLIFQVIKGDHHQINDRFTSMISHYLKQDNPVPSWPHLANALRSRSVNHPRLADRLMEELAKRESGLNQTLVRVLSFNVILGTNLNFLHAQLMIHVL